MTLFVGPGSLWKNGDIESFNGKLRNELFNGEIFDTVLEATIQTERRKNQHNTVRPHRSPDGRPPAPENYTTRPVANASARNTNIHIGTTSGGVTEYRHRPDDSETKDKEQSQVEKGMSS